MNSWSIHKHKKLQIKNAVFVEGLPGIGNAGKVAVDFIIENKKLKPIVSFMSSELPHAVFVEEDDTVVLPTLDLYHLKIGKQDYLFLAGDVQPSSEKSCYEFCDKLLEVLKLFGTKFILTLGGIGLAAPKNKPEIFCVGNDAKLIQDYKKKLGCKKETFGVVGPIIGVTGLLIGLAEKAKIPAVGLLIETCSYPGYVGVKEARKMLDTLNKLFSFKVSLKELDKEVSFIEKEIEKKVKDLEGLKTKEEHLKYIG